MKAERKNLINEKRHRLEEVLPLKMPYSLSLDPCNLCNFRCRFCAVQASGEELKFKKQLMPMDLYKKIIDDVSEFSEKLKVLRITGNGEPLLHPELPEMIRYAKQKSASDYTEIITNGSRLNPLLNQELVESGLDRIRISIEEISTEGYRNITGVEVDFDQLLANIKDLYDRSNRNGKLLEIYVKTVDAAVDTKEKKETFYNLFENICHRIFIDHIMPLWSDWDELSNRFELQQIGMHGQELQAVQVCPFPLYSAFVNPDGIVTMCCADWRRKLIIGDLNSQSLMDVWNGDVLKTFWIDMLSGRKDQYAMCKNCLYPMYDCNDNIDAYAEDILKRIQ